MFRIQSEPRRGFTLIELLVVIAIIAILAAILFPVFARAREKARQTACLNNQRQIVIATQLYTQNHDEDLPEADSMWKDIALDKGTLKCPSKSKKIANAYGFNASIGGRSLGELPDPVNTLIVCDSTSVKNQLIIPDDVDFIHANKVIAGFSDGHVVLTTASAVIPSICAATTDLMTNLPPPAAYATTIGQFYNTNNTIYNTPMTTYPTWDAGPKVWDRTLSYQYGRQDDTATGNPWGNNNNSLTCKYMLPAQGMTSNFICVYDRDAGQNPGMVLARYLPAVTPTTWWSVSFTLQCQYLSATDNDGRRWLKFYVDDTSNATITEVRRDSWDGNIKSTFNNVTFSPTVSGAVSQSPANRGVILDPYFSKCNKCTLIGYGSKVMMVLGDTVVSGSRMGSSTLMSPGRIVFANNGGYSNVAIFISDLKFGYK